MPELEDILRAEVTRRMQEFEPSAGLPGRIHTHVRRRRRQRHALAAASGSALVVAVAVGAFLIRPGNAVEVSDPPLPGATTSTAPADAVEPDDAPPDRPSATTDPTDPFDRIDPTVPTVPTDPTKPTEPAEPPGADQAPTTEKTTPPQTTGAHGPPGSTTTTVPYGGPLKPPDSDQPTLPCPPGVEIVLGPEGPTPPCIQVSSDQRLQVRNDTDHEVMVTVGGFVTDTLAPGATAVIGGEFGGYLEPGVHIVEVSPYAEDIAFPEIWFVP